MMKVLLGISGSIACYKSLDLARMLAKDGHEVKIVLTAGALKFLKPELFTYLGFKAVFLPGDDFTWERPGVLHIELAHWADLFVLCPGSANTIAKIANGQCDDLLTSITLTIKPTQAKMICPAMNNFMYANPATVENFEKLKQRGFFVLPAIEGELACGDFGQGKLPEVQKIYEVISSFPIQGKIQKNILITTGATISPLDPVRYMSNPSSGLTGHVIAKEFLRAGYQVTILKGRFSIPNLDKLAEHPNATVLTYTDAHDLFSMVRQAWRESDLFVAAAAVCDIEFKAQTEKIKKTSFTNQLEIQPTPDILSWVVSEKKTHQKVIGFAAETQMDEQIIEEKIKRKPVDLLAFNTVAIDKKETIGFNHIKGSYCLIDPKVKTNHKVSDKFELSQYLLNWYQKQ